MSDVEWHPVAAIFPMMSDREYLELVEDIREHGLREPIWVHSDGRVIDGRNRWLACRELGIEPTTKTYDGDDTGLVAFVVSLNLHRRHLDESQRAMVAARIANMKPGRPTETVSNDTVSVSLEDAAEMLSVGRASAARARTVLASPVLELSEAVESGKVAVSTAATIATAPPDEQRQVIAADDEKTIVKRAKESAAPFPPTRGSRHGWATGPKDCDWIAYAVVPKRTCYLLPALGIRSAWEKHGGEWRSKATGRRERFSWQIAENARYDTINIAMPFDALYEAIRDAMTVEWTT